LPELLNSSQKAFTTRSQTSIQERINCIRLFLDEYKANKENIAQTMSKEMGKPITQTLFDLNYDIDYIQWHIDHTESILNPEIAHQDENSIHTMYFEPK
jgi:acyl-CoA reductase-like NAD-dependent aldehyde dehydrogenase